MRKKKERRKKRRKERWRKMRRNTEGEEDEEGRKEGKVKLAKKDGEGRVKRIKNFQHIKEKNNQKEMYFLYSSILQNILQCITSDIQCFIQNSIYKMPIFTSTDVLLFLQLHPSWAGMEQTGGGCDC